MPSMAIAAAVQAGTITSGTGLFLTYAAQAATVYFGAQAAKRKAKAAEDAARTDRKILFRSSVAPRNYIYGETLLSGVYTYGVTYGPSQEYFAVVVTLADHECYSFQGYYLDGESVGSLTPEGKITDGKYVRSVATPISYRINIPDLNLPTDGVYEIDPPPMNVNRIAVSVPDGDGNGNRGLMVRGKDFVVIGTAIKFQGTYPAGSLCVLTYDKDVGDPTVTITPFLGIAAGERDTDLEAVSLWPDTSIGKYVARAKFEFLYNEYIYGGAMPNPSVLVRGKMCYDPRTDSVVWTHNPAIIARDWLTDVQGFNCDDSEIDDATVIAAANICDEQVEYKAATFHDRYTCDGTIYLNVAVRENLERILACMAGSAVYSSGQWRILAGAYRTPVMSLFDDDLAGGDIDTSVTMPYSSLFNAVRGQYINPDKKYALDDFPPYVSTTFMALDEVTEPLYEDFDFEMVSDPYRAQRLAKVVLFQSRQAIIDVAEWKLPAVVLQPGDTVYVTRINDGWDAKVFRVIERIFNPSTMRVKLTLREEAASSYDENYAEWINPDTAPNTTLPDPSFVNPITGLTVVSDDTTYAVSADGVLRAYALLTWNAITSSDVLRGGHIVLRWKRSNEVAFNEVKLLPETTEYRIYGVGPRDVLIIWMTAVNGIGVQSTESYNEHTVGDAVPSDGIGKVGANLLVNSSFVNTIGGWTTTAYSETPAQYRADYSQRGLKISTELPGSPGAVELNPFQVQTLANKGHAFSDAFIIDVDKNYFFQARVHAVDCAVKIGLALYDYAGVLQGIEWDWLDDNGDSRATNYAYASRDPETLGSYQTLQGVIKISDVSGAAKLVGRFVAFADGSVSILQSSSVRLYITEPMVAVTSIGASNPGKVLSVEWSPGPGDNLDVVEPGTEDAPAIVRYTDTSTIALPAHVGVAGIKPVTFLIPAGRMVKTIVCQAYTETEINAESGTLKLYVAARLTPTGGGTPAIILSAGVNFHTGSVFEPLNNDKRTTDGTYDWQSDDGGTVEFILDTEIGTPESADIKLVNFVGRMEVIYA